MISERRSSEWNFESEQRSLITIILGIFLYLMMTLITRSFIFWQIGSTRLFCGISRFLMLEKKLFTNFAFAWLFLIIYSPSTSVVFSLETTLLHNYGITTFQMSWYHKCFSYLGYCSNLSYFSTKVKHNNFVEYCSFFYFPCFCFSGRYSWFLVLTIIAFDNTLLINGEWLSLAQFFFHGTILSRTFLQEIAKLL